MADQPPTHNSLEHPAPVADERLAHILDDYLQAIEQGEPASPDELLAEYPDDAAMLRRYLSGLKLFQLAATRPLDSGPDRGAEGIVPRGTVGDFELRRVVGRGGMGVVYEAYERSLDRRVALKLLALGGAADEARVRRFRNEAQAAASIDHPHIVPVYAIGEEAGLHYYTMQLVEGPSLAELLEQLRSETVARHRSTTAAAPRGDRDTDTAHDASPFEFVPAGLSPDDGIRERVRAVAGLGVQAAEALHAAHECGIVHRDVKPSNLLVSADGKLWVTDFGLARFRTDAAQTQTGDILGTLRYMSPEQAAGNRALVDHRTDIYSLGVTLYELAALEHPHGEVSAAQMLLDGQPAPPRSLRSCNRKIPVDLETIVMKAMAQEPADRYQQAGELADDLARFLRGEAIRATPPTLGTTLTKWLRRRRRAVALAAVAAMVMLVVLAATSVTLAGKNRQVATALTDSQQHLARALDVLDRFGAQTADQLAAIPGAEGVRLALLEDSLAYYQQFEAEVDELAPNFTSVARAYGNMGVLHEKLGQRTEALEKLQAARELWRRRLARSPRDPQAQVSLCRVLNQTALVALDLGQVDLAADALDEAAAVVADLPETREVLVERALVLNHRGLLLRARGDLPASRGSFEQAIELGKQAVELDATQPPALRCLAVGYGNLASLDGELAPSSAAKAYRYAIGIQRKLVELSPSNRLYQGELARSYSNMGCLLARANDWAAARSALTSAIELQQHLVASSPASASYRRDLAISHNNLGMAQSRAGEPAATEASFQQAIDLQQTLAELLPHDARTQSELASVHNNLGLLHYQTHMYATAEAEFDRALELQAVVVAESPEVQRHRELHAEYLTNYVDCLRDQGKPTAVARLVGAHRHLASTPSTENP